MTTPSTARLGETVPVVVEVRSTVAQTATVRLFANGTLAQTKPVELIAGLDRITFDDKPVEAGFVRFRAVVEAALDTFSENDRADSNTIIKGEPRTLVLAGDDSVAVELVAALRAPAPAGRHDPPRGAPDRPRQPGRRTTAWSSSTCRACA